jgi:hypothetical protein
MELALLPAWRGQGIGGGLVQALVQEATAASLPVNLARRAEQPGPPVISSGRVPARVRVRLLRAPDLDAAESGA